MRLVLRENRLSVMLVEKKEFDEIIKILFEIRSDEKNRKVYFLKK